LEIALQQFTDDGAQFERARFFVQRSRLPDRLRVRLSGLDRIYKIDRISELRNQDNPVNRVGFRR